MIGWGRRPGHAAPPPPSSNRATREWLTACATGCTAIRCGAGPCRGAADPELAARLRDTVGTTRHGVLVVADCAAGTLAREPGPVHVGPIRIGDIATAAEWLDRTPHEPAHLTGLLAGAASS